MTDTRDGRAFVKGLFGGALIGAVAGVFFAPEIYAAFKNLRGQLTDAVADGGDVAADTYREAKTRAGDAVGDLQQKGRGRVRESAERGHTRRRRRQGAGKRGSGRARAERSQSRAAANVVRNRVVAVAAFIMWATVVLAQVQEPPAVFQGARGGAVSRNLASL